MSPQHETELREDPAGSTQGPTTGAPATTIDLDDDGLVRELGVELRTLLSLRTRTSARDRPLPTLASLVPPHAQQDPDARFAAITTLIEAGIAEMPDADHSTAADKLLGSGSGRWRPLSARGPEAAAPFGCGWDAYRRRRRSTDTSLLEETVDLLARTLVDLARAGAPQPNDAELEHQPGGDPVGTHEPAPRSTDDLPEPLVTIGPAADLADTVTATPEVEHDECPPDPAGARTFPGRGSRLLIAAVLATAVVLIAGAAGLAGAVLGRGGDSTQPTCRSLDEEVGATPGDSDPDLAAWTRPFEEFVSSEGIADATRCASLIARWEHGAIQRVGTGDPAFITALIGSEIGGEMVVVHLTSSELRAFGRTTDPHGPDRGDPLGETLGAVVGRHEGPAGERVVAFEDGLLVTEPNDAPTFALAGAWVDLWNESGGIDGGLGIPLSDRTVDPVTGGLFQQFERGTISTTIDGQVQVTADQHHYAMALPDDPRSKVLVIGQTGFWWYVDAEGVRHHVATGDNQTCVRYRMGVPVHFDQNAAAVATLPAGDQFQCP